MTNPLSSVLDWLRAGYPDGVPPKDLFPLLALLTRTLRPEELDAVVQAVIAESPDGDIGASDVRSTIERVTDAAVVEADVRDVAARLAAAGWPLSEAPDDAQLHGIDDGALDPTPRMEPDRPHPSSPERPGLVQRIVAWLTAGYPQGVPTTDRVVLMALLRRRLTDAEVEHVATRLIDAAQTSDIDATSAGALITQYTDDLPSDHDMTRLASHLAAKGWPLRSER